MLHANRVWNSSQGLLVQTFSSKCHYTQNVITRILWLGLYILDVLISSKQIHTCSYLQWRFTKSYDQFTPITTVMVLIPVAAMNCSRPYSRRALILQVIIPLCDLGSGHIRLSFIARYHGLNHTMLLHILISYDTKFWRENIVVNLGDCKICQNSLVHIFLPKSWHIAS